jgi:hypothetical protein
MFYGCVFCTLTYILFEQSFMHAEVVILNVIRFQARVMIKTIKMSYNY